MATYARNTPLGHVSPIILMKAAKIAPALLTAQAKIKELESQVQDHQTQLTQASDRNADLTHQVSTLQTRIEDQAKTIQEHEAKISEQASALADYADLTRRYDAKQLENEELRANVVGLRESLLTAERERHLLQAKAEAAVQACPDMNAHNDTLIIERGNTRETWRREIVTFEQSNPPLSRQDPPTSRQIAAIRPANDSADTPWPEEGRRQSDAEGAWHPLIRPLHEDSPSALLQRVDTVTRRREPGTPALVDDTATTVGSPTLTPPPFSARLTRRNAVRGNHEERAQSGVDQAPAHSWKVADTTEQRGAQKRKLAQLEESRNAADIPMTDIELKRLKFRQARRGGRAVQPRV